MDQLGPNALGEVLEPGRVTDCHLGLLLPPGPTGEPEAGRVLVVAPAALLHPGVPQPAGSLVYALLTGHPEREPGELLFVATSRWSCAPDLRTPGRRSVWTPTRSPRRSSAAGGTANHRAAGRRPRFEEARSLTRPAMSYARGQLRGRLTARLAHAHRRWRHLTSGRQPGDRFL